MTFGAPDSATSNNVPIPSIVILGTDAILAALPATPIQLAHACVLAGFQTVIPASWGDELIAAASLRALRHHGQLPAIQCSCPYVAHRLLAVGSDLRPFLLSLVAPPVVLARYLRGVHSQGKLRITYVGRCPGAADEAIDARLTPEELLAMFADRQIALDVQPDVFDSVIPPDRRRYRSQPGGLPTADMLWSDGANGGVARSLVELHGDELPVELAQQLLTGKPVLIDVAPRLGCVCSGAAADIDPTQARARVTALEPPRAPSPVLEETIATDAILPLPASPRSAIDVVSPPASAPVGEPVPNEVVRGRGSPELADLRSETDQATSTHPPVVGRRHSPTRGIARPLSGALPTARDADGRQLPRTYVARRRSPVRTTRTTPTSPAPVVTATGHAPAASVEQETSASGEAIKASAITGGEPYSEPTPEPALTSALSFGAAPPIATAIELEGVESTAALRAPAPRAGDDAEETVPRFSERAIALPVTPLSDARPRDERPPHAAGDPPIMQLLTLGLLIAMIVLVSAAVGVLVGRWMTQR